MSKLSYTKLGNEFTLDTEQLNEAGFAYLLQYGFAQSLQDSVAGRAKAVKEELIKAKAAEIARDHADETDEGREELLADWLNTEAESIADQIDMDVLGTMQKRFDAILAGTVATRAAAEPKDPYAAIIREALQSAAKAKGKKLPKADSDEYKALAERFRTAKAEWLAEELERRQAALADDDFDIEV